MCFLWGAADPLRPPIVGDESSRLFLGVALHQRLRFAGRLPSWSSSGLESTEIAPTVLLTWASRPLGPCRHRRYGSVANANFPALSALDNIARTRMNSGARQKQGRAGLFYPCYLANTSPQLAYMCLAACPSKGGGPGITI